MVDNFENLSGLKGLDYLVANSPEELLSMIQAIHLPTKIISIYAVGAKHVCWLQTLAKLKKIPKIKEK